MSVRAHTSRRLRLATILAIAVAAIATAVPTVTAHSRATGQSAEALAARAAVGPQSPAAGTSASALIGGAPAVAGGAPASAAAAAGPMLGGFTAQGWPAVVQLSADRRRLAVAEIGLTLNCTSGNELDLPVDAGPVPVASTGSFHIARTIPAQPGNPVSLTGGSESFSGVLHRASSTLSGTWRMRLNFTASDGTADHCDSGPVHLSARL